MDVQTAISFDLESKVLCENVILILNNAFAPVKALSQQQPQVSTLQEQQIFRLNLEGSLAFSM